MKYPKLKNTFACGFLLFLPIFPPIITLIVSFFMIFFNDTDKYIPAAIAIFFITVILSIIYFLKIQSLIMPLEIISDIINNWKRDRLWFETECNGHDRQTAEKIISKRARFCGKLKQPVPSTASPVFIRHKLSYSWFETTAAKEKITLLYSVNYLDKNTYKNIMNSANVCSKAVQCKKEDIRFIEKKQRKSPLITAVAVIILADSVSAEIPELSRKLTDEKQNKIIVPAVVDFSVNRYYFNPGREYYEPTFFSVPARNLARKMIIRTLFAGKLPYKNNENITIFEYKGIDMEMSFWDFAKQELQDSVEFEKYLKKTAKKLNDGDIFMDEENMIFCKINNKTVIITVEVNEEDNSIYDVLVPDLWVHPKPYKISKKDKSIIKEKIEKYLTQNSYNYKFI